MKIEIEWHASYEATLKIQEQEYKISLLPEPKVTPLNGAPPLERNFSFASVVMLNITPVIYGLMQAQCITDDYVDPSGDRDNTFRAVPEYVARATHKKVKDFIS